VSGTGGDGDDSVDGRRARQSRHTRETRPTPVTRHTRETRPTRQALGAALRRAGAEWVKEVGPTFVVIGGLCLAGIGSIQYSEGTDAQAIDNRLRASGALTMGEVVEVDSTHRSYRRGGGSTSYTPTTRQVVDGREFTTRLDNYDITNDPDLYQVGDTLPVMYDPADPRTVGIKSDRYPPMFEYQVTSGRTVGVPGAVAAVVGIPFLSVQIWRSITRRIRTRETRKWANARRRVTRSRRAAQRAADAAGTTVRPPVSERQSPPR
jgi:hypothetical protein